MFKDVEIKPQLARGLSAIYSWDKDHSSFLIADLLILAPPVACSSLKFDRFARTVRYRDMDPQLVPYKTVVINNLTFE